MTYRYTTKIRNRQLEVRNKRSLWFNPNNTWKQNHRRDKLTVDLTKCFLFVIMLSPILKGLHTLSTENKNQIANSQKSIIHKNLLTSIHQQTDCQGKVPPCYLLLNLTCSYDIHVLQVRKEHKETRYLFTLLGEI